MKEYFSVSSSNYVHDTDINIVRPASLNNPKDNAVMFVTEAFLKYADALLKCRNCLVFWPEGNEIPQAIADRHAVCVSANPHLQYCMFFRENNITYLPEQEKMDYIDGSFISPYAVIGKNVKIFPGAYIGGQVTVGDNVYIGAGVKILGEVKIGDNVVIRENTVIGADGLSTDRDVNGRAATMPQFGGVILEDDVQIGAMTVIARGAIDNTVIGKGSKVDNCCFISHNVQVGKDTFIVGETIMFGSSSVGDRAYISGNSTIRNGIRIGNEALVGMGSNVIKDIQDGAVVKGNPAR